MTPSETLDQLGRDYWRWRLESDPVMATYYGHHEWNDRLADVGPDGRESLRTRAVEFRGRLAGIERGGLTASELVTWDILSLALDEVTAELAHKFWQWSGVDQMSGVQIAFLESVNFHPFRHAQDARDYLTRLAKLPTLVMQTVENLREGMKEGRTAPRIAVDRVKAQLRELVTTPPDRSPLAGALEKMKGASMDGSERASLGRAIMDAVDRTVRVAFQRFLDFLEKEYVAREEVGLSSLPGGLDAYRHRCRLHTTTPMTPEEIHRIGLEELESIGAEMKGIASARGHDGDIPSFLARLASDPAHQPGSRQEVLEGFTEVLRRAEAELPKWFGILPRNRCEIKPIEEFRERDCVAAFYYPPDSEGKRSGIFYANTYRPPSRLKFNAAALTVHEAVPGHHLQIAIANEQKDLPEFRRHASFTAYIEGWALYAERLAAEMGLYRDDLERFGMLTYQALRACRLVVDTGLHAMGWSRERAIDFMKRHVAESEHEIVNEVDRYVIWPGQALAYKIGQREIRRLRSEAASAMGARFDIRGFHDTVLRHGAVPLTTLADLVRGWAGPR